MLAGFGIGHNMNQGPYRLLCDLFCIQYCCGGQILNYLYLSLLFRTLFQYLPLFSSHLIFLV